MMVSLVLQLCMFLVIAMGKILCYDNCMMKNILKNKKFWKIICILAIIAYTAKNLFIGADTDEGYGIMAGYRLAMGDRLLLGCLSALGVLRSEVSQKAQHHKCKEPVMKIGILRNKNGLGCCHIVEKPHQCCHILIHLRHCPMDRLIQEDTDTCLNREKYEP